MRVDAADSPLYRLCRRALCWLLVCSLPVILLILFSGTGYLLLPSTPAAVPVVPAGARPYAEQLDAVADRYRGGVVLAVVPPAAPGEPTRVRLRTQARVDLAVLVDPSRAEVLGEVAENAGITGGLQGLHQRLSLGWLGASVADLALLGSALFAVTGGVRWWWRRDGGRWFGLAGIGLLIALVLGGFGWLPAWDRLYREASANPPLPQPVPRSDLAVRPGDPDALGRPLRPAADGMPVPRSVGTGGTGLTHDPAVPDPAEGGNGGDPDVAVADLETVIAVAARQGMPGPLEIVLPQTWGGAYLVREGAGAPPYLWQRRTLYLDQYTARPIEPEAGSVPPSHAHRAAEPPSTGRTDLLQVAAAAGPLIAVECVRAALLVAGVLWFRRSRPPTASPRSHPREPTPHAPEPVLCSSAPALGSPELAPRSPESAPHALELALRSSAMAPRPLEPGLGSPELVPRPSESDLALPESVPRSSEPVPGSPESAPRPSESVPRSSESAPRPPEPGLREPEPASRPPETTRWFWAAVPLIALVGVLAPALYLLPPLLFVGSLVRRLSRHHGG